MQLRPRPITSSRGAVLIEYVLAIVLMIPMLFLFIDLAFAAFHFSRAATVTRELTRELAIGLGEAWEYQPGSTSGENGCNDLLNSLGNNFLYTHYSPSYSMFEGETVTYFMGSTTRDGTAIIFNPNSPYAILRIVGEVEVGLLVGRLMPKLFTEVESTALIEFSERSCGDYP